MKKFKKIWRKLALEDKTTILSDYFNINESNIKRIRKIKDSKRRLIEAARLQFESFGNIHTDLTAWIAGYRSDVAVRQKFGSSIALREKFIQFKNNFPEIKPSWSDIRNNVILPEQINEDVAEEVGIHIGDGNLHFTIDKKGGNGYNYRIDGNLTDEFLYHDGFIKPLMKKLYNCEGFKLINKKRNSVQSSFRSKLIFHYKKDILGLPAGPKFSIEIPKCILRNNDLMKRCIVGILDTDFNLDKDMCINGKITCLKVIKQIDEFLNKDGIVKNCRIFDNIGWIKIRKKDSLKIIEEWKLHNPKHLSKYSIWREYKKFLPFTYTEERLAVLNGKLDIDDLVAISQERKKEANIGPFYASDQNALQSEKLIET